MIFSKSPYWFIRVYFYLFLIAPLLNKWLENDTFRDKIYMLCVLAFISVFMAIMNDASVYDGKNVVLFMFLYVLGDVLRFKQDSIEKWNIRKMVTSWILLNVVIVTSWLIAGESISGKVIWHLSFMYSHPLLIANGVLFFLIFSKLKIKSKTINYLAGSAFSIYILTECSLIKIKLIQPVLAYIYNISNESALVVISSVLLFTLFVMLICVIVDKAFCPIFLFFQNKVSSLIDNY